VKGLEAALNATFDKPPLELPDSKKLPMISKSIGSPVRYKAKGPDEVLSGEMIETLGTTDYLVRQYQDLMVAEGESGSLVNLNVNYYGTGSATPHVPEICWAASGREEARDSRCNFDVKGVKRRDGSVVDLRMKMISFMPPRGNPLKDEKSGKPLYTNVAYVFQVNGRYVASPQEVSSQFWKATYRFAYHAKIEVTPMMSDATGKPGPLTCTQEQAQKIVSDFVRDALYEIEGCLPDPAVLTNDGPTPTGHP
jgi:hypothetical protein